MHFEFTDEQRLLADSLGRYFSEKYGDAERERIATSAAGFDVSHWRALNELGVTLALFPESVGGFGGSSFDVAVVFEQIGSALVVEPFLGTLMAGTAMGSNAPAALLNGSEIFAFAHQEAALHHDPVTILTRAMQEGGNWRLSGHKAVVRQLEAADDIVVTAQTASGPAVFLVEPGTEGVSIQGYAVIDGGRGGELVLNGAPAILISEGPAAQEAIARALAVGTAALCWEAVGAMDRLRDVTLDYMRTRQQFGRAIGTFQALQHRMATVVMEIEQARSAAINASAAIDAGSANTQRFVSAAKYTINHVGMLVAEEAIQIHGGIAMTWELAASRYAKRLIQISQDLGDEDYHLARYISLEAAT